MRGMRFTSERALESAASCGLSQVARSAGVTRSVVDFWKKGPSAEGHHPRVRRPLDGSPRQELGWGQRIGSWPGAKVFSKTC